jgi:hypothetical protein
VVAVPLHLRIGDAGEGRRRGDADPGDQREHRVAENGGEREAAGNALQRAVDAAIDVGDGAGAGDELAHQHEQRDDGEDVVAQRLVGGARQHPLDDGEIAGDQIDAQRARCAERHRDVDAEQHHPDEADQQDDRDIDFEHALAS